MRFLEHHFTRTHGYVALGFLMVFSSFTLFLVCHPKNSEGLANIVVTTLATVTGPMVGAVARGARFGPDRNSFNALSCITIGKVL